MKVKELIEQLQKLDQEKNIWVLYDGYGEGEPDFQIATEEEEVKFLDKIRVGDYIHYAG